MANENGWGDGSSNNAIGWGQGANNATGWGSSQATSWSGLTNIVGTSIDTDAQAFLTASAITGTTQLSAINTLVTGLKTDGLWTKMKAIYPFVTDNRNLLSYTEVFSGAYWDKGLSTVIDNNTTAPNGASTACKLTEAAGTGSHHIHELVGPITAVVGQAYTMSVYVKQINSDSQRYVQLPFFLAGFGANAYVNFDILNGVVGTIGSSITSSSITSVGSGWYRLTATATATAAGSSGSQLSFIPASTSTRTESYTVTAGSEKSAYIWGFQLENSATVTDYQSIATTQQAFISSQHKFNLKDPRDLNAAYRLTFGGGLTHDSNGVLGNGVNGYAVTYFNCVTGLPSTNIHTSWYQRTASTLGAFSTEIAPDKAYTGSWLTFRTNNKVSGNAYFSAGNDAIGASVSNTLSGFLLGSKSASNSRKLYRNGSVLATTTTYDTTALPTENLRLWGNSFPSGAFSGNNCAFSSIGDGLTDADAINLYNRVQAFQTTLNRAV